MASVGPDKVVSSGMESTSTGLSRKWKRRREREGETIGHGHRRDFRPKGGE